MKKHFSGIFKKSVLFILLMVFVSFYVFSDVYGNWGECTFLPGCAPGSGGSTRLYVTESGDLMGMYIVEGAGYVLGAYSGVGSLLRQYELSSLYGADTTATQNTLDKIISDLENARDIYYFINYIAAVTPYNEAVIERLKTFGYDEFEKNEELLAPVFDRVEEYLKNGDVRGVFSKILKDIDSLLYQLYPIKKTVDTGTLPDIKSTWKLNQSFMEVLLFGQYFSRVIYEVK